MPRQKFPILNCVRCGQRRKVTRLTPRHVCFQCLKMPPPIAKKTLVEDATLDDALNGLLVATEDLQGEDLETMRAKFITHYPQFRSELQEVIAFQKINAALPEIEISPEEEADLIVRGKKIIDEVIGQHMYGCL